MATAKIFVVEDNPSDVFILRLALKNQGGEFEMELAVDGEQAMQFLERQGADKSVMRPGVILLDLHLPKHDGIEVLRAIRQNPVLHQTTVIVITSSASPQEQAALRRWGAAFRLKPKGLADFARLADDLLSICRESGHQNESDNSDPEPPPRFYCAGSFPS